MFNIYRPPGAINGMPASLLLYVENAIQEKIPTLILGDFNFPNINWDNCTVSSRHMGQDIFLDRMVSLGLSQLIREPTHRSGNVLDLVFVSEPNLIQNLEVKPPIPGCDHHLVTGLISTNFDFKNEFPKFLFAKGDYVALDGPPPPDLK